MTLYRAARSQVHILNCSFISFVIAFTGIELIHRRLGPAVNQHLKGIDRSFETGLDDFHLVLRDRFQNVVRGILPRRRTTNADFHSDELNGPQRVDHRFDAVVAAVASGLLNAQAAWLEIKIVMHENEIVRGKLVLAEKTLERRTHYVHEVERAGQFD